MKRNMRVLLGLMIVATLYFVPEAPLAEAKRVLEVIVVVQLCLEVLKP